MLSPFRAASYADSVDAFAICLNMATVKEGTRNMRSGKQRLVDVFDGYAFLQEKAGNTRKVLKRMVSIFYFLERNRKK